MESYEGKDDLAMSATIHTRTWLHIGDLSALLIVWGVLRLLDGHWQAAREAEDRACEAALVRNPAEPGELQYPWIWRVCHPLRRETRSVNAACVHGALEASGCVDAMADLAATREDNFAAATDVACGRAAYRVCGMLFPDSRAYGASSATDATDRN